jgi:hypothetical protein
MLAGFRDTLVHYTPVNFHTQISIHIMMEGQATKNILLEWHSEPCKINQIGLKKPNKNLQTIRTRLKALKASLKALESLTQICSSV